MIPFEEYQGRGLSSADDERALDADGLKVTVHSRQVAAGTTPLSSDEHQRAPVEIGGKRPLALIADDDPLVVTILQRVLTRKGFDSVTARDGDEAWVLVNSHDVSIVLTDLEMPRSGGLDLLKSVREIKPHLPFIFVTGRPTLESAVEIMNAGAAAYVPKPFEPDAIIGALDRVTRELVGPMSTQTQGRGAQRRFGQALSDLYLHYQPIARWSTRSTFSHEALMRTSFADVPHPGAFLDLAEGLGRVHDLGRAVRRRAASDIAAAADTPGTAFINLHPEELLDDDLFDEASPLGQMSERIYLEITERESLSKMTDAVDRIRRLKKLGFRIAIDDIGAGYSGLNSFVDLEPDLVKIDMGLVRGINDCSRRRKLVGSLVILARELQIEVIAEGVETEAELATLLELDCDLFQGYLFAKPGPAFPNAKFPEKVTA